MFFTEACSAFFARHHFHSVVDFWFNLTVLTTNSSFGENFLLAIASCDVLVEEVVCSGIMFNDPGHELYMVGC